MKKKRNIIIAMALVMMLALIAGCGIYLSDYYRADETALAAMNYRGNDVEIKEDGASISFVPENAETGLIFYPGGKVQCEAYAPLLLTCAREGILCELVKMPGNLAAYATNDLSETNLKVLSIYGSEDGVLNRESYEKNRKNLPERFTEKILEGGCHGYFGNYGMQKGDGEPTITREEQVQQTTEEIIKFIADECNH